MKAGGLTVSAGGLVVSAGVLNAKGGLSTTGTMSGQSASFTGFVSANKLSAATYSGTNMNLNGTVSANTIDATYLTAVDGTFYTLGIWVDNEWGSGGSSSSSAGVLLSGSYVDIRDYIDMAIYSAIGAILSSQY